jgi:hypothetical protein
MPSFLKPVPGMFHKGVKQNTFPLAGSFLGVPARPLSRIVLGFRNLKIHMDGFGVNRAMPAENGRRKDFRRGNLAQHYRPSTKRAEVAAPLPKDANLPDRVEWWPY